MSFVPRKHTQSSTEPAKIPLAAHSHEATKRELSEPAGSSLREMPESAGPQIRGGLRANLIATLNETEFDVSYCKQGISLGSDRHKIEG